MDKKILIVDDDFDTLHMVGKMLERNGFQIVAANNGEKAIQIALAENPDLILLDVMMPGKDGFQVTRELRATESTAFIPIILFTAKAQVDDKLEGFEAGADDYLTKPTHPSELIARVKSILNRPKTGTLVMPQDTQETTPSVANLIGVIAAKGGVGVSTLALNLAITLHIQTEEYVTLAELRPGLGTIGLQLGYRNSDALNNLLHKNVPEITVEAIEGELITHGSGIQLLLASYMPGDASLIKMEEALEEIATQLPQIAPYTVLDLGSGLMEINKRIVPQCTQIIVVLESAHTTIIQTKALIHNLIDLGIEEKRISPVLVNRLRLENAVPNLKVQEQLGLQLSGVILPAPQLAYDSNARHEPLLIYQPESIVSRQFIKLGESLLAALKVKEQN